MFSFPTGARTRVTLSAIAVGPVFVIFLSSNIVNAGNLLFNVLFSRWMGPELFGELATLLTIKLAILGVLGALQIAVSHRVAREPVARTAPLDAALSRLNHACFVGLWFLLPALIAVIWIGDLSQRLGLGSPLLLVLLALSLPFAVPLSILRGVVYGRLDTRHVLMSANVEMLVRLWVAVLAWHAGYGLTGVVAAVAISIIAGWMPLCGQLGKDAVSETQWTVLGRSVALAAVPFALLHAAQVVLLDGDVIIARLYLDADEAGYVAALSLFQRIQFFACFGLSSVLLPAVARAISEGRSVAGLAVAVAALFGCVSVVVLVGTALFPDQVIVMFVGQSFLPAAPLLIFAAASSVAFTLSYLLATYLSAIGDRRGIWLVTLASPIQVVAMSSMAESLSAMLVCKLGCQIVLAVLLFFFALSRTLHRGTPGRALITA